MDDVPAEGYQLVGSCRSGSPATIGTTVVVARRNGKAVQLTCHQLALSCTTSQRPAAHLGVGLEAIGQQQYCHGGRGKLSFRHGRWSTELDAVYNHMR